MSVWWAGEALAAGYSSCAWPGTTKSSSPCNVIYLMFDLCVCCWLSEVRTFHLRTAGNITTRFGSTCLQTAVFSLDLSGRSIAHTPSQRAVWPQPCSSSGQLDCAQVHDKCAFLAGLLCCSLAATRSSFVGFLQLLSDLRIPCCCCAVVLLILAATCLADDFGGRGTPNPLPCTCTDVDPRESFISIVPYTCW